MGASKGINETEGHQRFRACLIGADGRVQEEVAAQLSSAGFRVSIVSALNHEGIQRSQDEHDLLIGLHDPPKFDALELLRQVRKLSPIPVFVVSGEPTLVVCEAAIRGGASRFFSADDVSQLGSEGRTWLDEEMRRSEPRRPSVWTAYDARVLRDRELFMQLHRLLYETRGNVAEMARRMGKDRSTVRYHLRRFDMLGRDRVGDSSRLRLGERSAALRGGEPRDGLS